MKAAGDRPGHLSRTSPPQGEKRYPFRQPAPPKGPRRLTGVLPSGHAASSYSLMEAWVAPLPRGCPRPESLLPESSTARLPFRWGTAQPWGCPRCGPSGTRAFLAKATVRPTCPWGDMRTRIHQHYGRRPSLPPARWRPAPRGRVLANPLPEKRPPPTLGLPVERPKPPFHPASEPASDPTEETPRSLPLGDGCRPSTLMHRRNHRSRKPRAASKK